MPHKGQLPVLDAFFMQWMEGLFMRCGRKYGKALDLDTPILTPSGFIRIGSIVEGDTVFNEKGLPVSVLVAHDVIEDAESFRVHFCDGSYLDACADHQWLTWTKADRKNFRRGFSYSPSVKSTLEIFNTQMNGKEYNHSIPYAEPIQMEHRDLPIDPYLLGLWLGDGCTHKSGIATIDEEILDSFRDAGFGITHYENCDYGITDGFRVLLIENNLLGNKHVPYQYFFSSEQQRRDLLCGLMDSDGTVNKSGNQCEFINKNYLLSDAVHYLAVSLGMKPKSNIKKVKYKGEVREYKRVTFRPYGQVFRLERKQSRVSSNSIKNRHRTIIRVEKIENRPMRCLTVSGESKLFLAGANLIPTHNTDVAIACMYFFGRLFPNSECYYVADEKDHARDICWDNRRLPEFFTSFRKSVFETDDEFLARRRRGSRLQDKWVDRYNNSEMTVRLTNGSILKVDGAKNYSKADGLSPTFVVYDEFKHHDKRYDQAMRPNLRALKGRILIVGTPPDNEDNYYCETEDEFNNKPKHTTMLMPSWMNPHVYTGPDDPALLAERRAYERKGELHVYLREYECQIVPDSQRQIFPMFDVPRIDHVSKCYTGVTNHFAPYDVLVSQVRHRQRDFDFYVCFDAGSAVCFGVLFVAINRHTKQIVVLDEIYETDQMKTSSQRIYRRAEDIMDEIHPFRPDWYQIYDHAATWFSVEVAEHFDEALMPCSKDVKKKEAKLTMMKEIMLEEGLFVLSDRCQSFVKEISHYAKNEKGKIPKENDHLLDCMRYILNESNYSTMFEEYKKNKNKDDEPRFYTPNTEPVAHQTNLTKEQIRLLSGEEDDY